MIGRLEPGLELHKYPDQRTEYLVYRKTLVTTFNVLMLIMLKLMITSLTSTAMLDELKSTKKQVILR